ncbi:expressed unknown protein [Seminavis robusta]|uniref:Uncharacterized protein n=1 Tax=Seminavis robusta TaxID=568900 RepID=A0A9N8HRM9_9STRA|nr:expressed unknown protein [Seminavis robusta]|eukprot:Sro1416_g270810.1 n/a (174) ;mRNA; f:8571-9330
MLKASDHIRSRPSSVLVQETRGAPYKAVSILLASFFTVCGLRDIFFCGTPLTSDPTEALLLGPFKDCQNDAYQQGVSGVLGALLILVAMLRGFMCTTEHTADLYFSMIPLVFIDAAFLYLALRPGVGAVPTLYVAMQALGLVYEGYVLQLARRDYLVVGVSNYVNCASIVSLL